jgi:hypothetical protein
MITPSLLGPSDAPLPGLGFKVGARRRPTTFPRLDQVIRDNHIECQQRKRLAVRVNAIWMPGRLAIFTMDTM